MIGPGELLAAAAVLVGAVAAMAWWLLREAHSKVTAESAERAAALEAERRAREEDRHALRNEINAVGGKLHAHELKVAQEYVNHERLGERMAAAIKPMEDGIGRLEGAVARIFSLLDRKEGAD